MNRKLISFLFTAAVLASAWVCGAAPAGKTLRVSFAQNLQMKNDDLLNHMADWTVKASAVTGWCNIVPSTYPDGSRGIRDTNVTVGPWVMNWTDGTPAGWGVHINHELCGKGLVTQAPDSGDTASLANHPTVAQVFPRGEGGLSPVTMPASPATLQGRPGYSIGAPVQFNMNGTGPGSVSVNGVLPGETYTVTVLAGRPNDVREDATVYSVDGGTVTDVWVVCTGAESTGAKADTTAKTVTVPMPRGNSNNHWAMMTFTVTAAGDTLTVLGTAHGNIIALSVTGPAAEPSADPVDCLLTFKLKEGGETKGLSFDADTGMNVLTGSSSATEAGGAFGEGGGQPILFPGLKSANGSDWTGTVQIFSEGNRGNLGPKLSGVGAALTAAHFTVGQKKSVMEVFGIDEAAFSRRLVGGVAGVPFQNDYSYGWADHTQHAPGIALTGVFPGREYEVSALVGRGNTYVGVPARGAYYVTGGMTSAAEAVAYGGLTEPEVPTVAGGRVTVTTASAWALMRFRVMATGPTLTLQSELNPGNFRALRVRSADPVKTWVGLRRNGSTWQDPMGWSPKGVPTAEDTVRLAEHPEDRIQLRVPVDAALARLTCSDSSTMYMLAGLPDSVPVHSDGQLTLMSKTNGVFGQTVSGRGAQVLGASVTLNGRVSAPVEVNDGGELTVGPEAVLDRVTVYPGCVISGTGRVGTLVLHDGAAVRADPNGALRVGTLSVPVPALYDLTLPVGTVLPVSPVTVQADFNGSTAPVLTAETYPQLDVEWQASDGEPLSWLDGTLQQAAPVQPGQPAMLTFVDQAKGKLGAEVTAVLTVDGQPFFSILPEDGVVREKPAYYAGTAGASDVFYYNPNAAHPKLRDGKSLTVNGQMHHPDANTNKILSVRMPFAGLSAKTLLSGRGRVTAELFASTYLGDAQTAPVSLGYRIDLLAADGKTLLCSTDPTPAEAGEDDWVTGTADKGPDSVMTESAVLVPTEAAAQATEEAGFVLKYSMRCVSVGGTFGGLRSVRFDAAPDVPPAAEIPETLPGPDGTEVPVSDALHDAVQAFAEANGLTGRIELVPGTVRGELLTADRMNAAAEVFEGILRRLPEAGTLAAEAADTVRLEVSYTFDVAGFVLTDTGVEAAVRLLGADGQPTTLKPEASLYLLAAPQADGAFVRCPDAVFDRAALKLTLPARAAEASFYKAEAAVE